MFLQLGLTFYFVCMVYRPTAVLEAVGVDVLVPNDEVGHGVDHQEIAVMYEWLPQWVQHSDGDIPRGGVMGWPLMVFLPFLDQHRNLFKEANAARGVPTEPLSTFMVAHFGAGCAEPYTEFPTVVCTPNCARPDLQTGYRAQITSRHPEDSMRLVHAEQHLDWQALAQGVYATVHMMERLRAAGIVGERLQPPAEVFPAHPPIACSSSSSDVNSDLLVDWIRENHSTVFHWGCTCQAGVQGRVADELFRLRARQPPTGGAAAALAQSHANATTKTKTKAEAEAETSSDLVRNLRVGSAAALPELPDGNPHLTVTAFAMALAKELARTQANRRQTGFAEPKELRKAVNDLDESAFNMIIQEVTNPGALVSQQQQQQLLQIRRPGTESPDLSKVADQHYRARLARLEKQQHQKE
jgi:hypothetical protein